MCRHLAYLGPPTPVGELLTRGPHSLRTQSWAPREMRGGGTINADGFGVAWWHLPDAASADRGPGVIWHGGAPPDIRTATQAAAPPGDRPTETTAVRTNPSQGDGRDSAGAGGGSEAGRSGAAAPVVSRYRNAAPIWSDPAVDEVLPQIRSTAVLAAIRSATVGMPIERSACAPFTHGRWAFSHNGAIPDWRRVLTEVATEFGSPPLLEAESLTDSAALWVILRGLLDGRLGQAPSGVPAGSALNDAADSENSAVSSPRRSATFGVDDSTRAGEPGGRSRSSEFGSAEGQSFGVSAAFGSSVTVTSSSGAQPEVRAWGWAVTSEGSGASGATAASGAAASAAGAHDSAASTSARPQGEREFLGGAGNSVGGGVEPGEALRRVMAAVLARSPKARLNLLLGDGVGVWGSTWHHSLAVLEHDGFVVVASEPFDDDSRWRPIADRQLVRVVGGRVSVEPLDIEIGRAGS